MKICTKCKKELEISEFTNDNSKKDKLHPSCKECAKLYRKLSEERIKKYRDDNRELLNEKGRKIHEKNKEKLKIKKKIYREENKDLINKKAREKYKLKDKNFRSEYQKKYRAERKLNDPIFKLKLSIRSLVNKAISRNGYKKKSRTNEILGCSYEELIAHLNNNLYGFMVGDKELDIDHIVPMSNANTEEEAIKLNHYTNLQLLPSEYNKWIKINNIWNKEEFENWLENQNKNKYKDGQNND